MEHVEEIVSKTYENTSNNLFTKLYNQYETCDNFIVQFYKNPTGFYENADMIIQFYGELKVLEQLWNMLDNKSIFIKKYHILESSIDNLITISTDMKKRLLILCNSYRK